MAGLKDMEFRQLTADMNLLPFHCVDDDLNNLHRKMLRTTSMT